MRSNTASLVAVGFLSIGVLHDSVGKEPPGKDPEPAKQEEAAACSTLSEMGIDFGAAELGRFAELGLNDMQKKRSLGVLRDRKAKIELLCERMTEALAMDEGSGEEKRAKEVELAAILEEFKSVQQQIMAGLHAILTDEQMSKLAAMKKRERVEKANREKEAATG